jgi:2-polyprenyl-3-methyl-5-hydroxy-6-metoxy-1,4-benzoquinol methylase
MPRETTQRFEKLAQMHRCIDLPRPDQTVYDECISIAGWLFAGTHDPSTCRVRAWLDGIPIGETRVLFARPDVSDFLSVPRETPAGFRFLARTARQQDVPRDATIQLTASWSGDAAEYQLGRVSLRLVPASLQNRPHGEVVYPAQSTLLHRENIYGSGPPIPEPGAEMLRLIVDYLSPGSSIVDVGCGAGACGPPLMARGHAWTGLEVNPHCWELLEQRGLPFRKIDWETQRFPCADQEFDEAICIEVLEHIEQPEPFLEEISRIVRKRALFSVPNIEVIPYFKDWDAVPWHMLEGDHKNFFTRTNLRELLARHFSRVEVFSYGEHPIRTRDGIPLHIHLWAIADV